MKPDRIKNLFGKKFLHKFYENTKNYERTTSQKISYIILKLQIFGVSLWIFLPLVSPLLFRGYFSNSIALLRMELGKLLTVE